VSAQTDLDYSLNRAGNALLDACCACRTARAGPIPADHRRLISAAIRKLEWASEDLWKAANEPWQQTSATCPQIELFPCGAGPSTRNAARAGGVRGGDCVSSAR
jgi:hypothetical protein